ncbi:MAG: nitroreductase family protein [Candidatus Pacearchaeota archaeon]
MELDEVIKKRKSVRKYSDEKPDWRLIIESINYARYAPMAGGQFTLKFIVVSDKEKINQISEATQQDFVGTAHYIVVVVSDREFVKKYYDHFDKGFGAQQAGAAIQNFLLALTERGLSTCWVGFFYEDKIKRVLDIPEKMCVEAIFPIGKEHPFIKTREKKRIDIDSIVFFEKYGRKQMTKDTIQKFETI